MKIYKMTATFGKLEHAELTLQPGLNILTAPNEWGKSTWCAFLVAMLYGLDTRAKTTKTALAGKERYAPWSGNPMAGRIDLNWNGRDITIERRTKGRVPLGEFKAYETDSGLPVPELTAANCGQQLLGVEQTVFRRAGFIRQSDLPVTQDEALRRRLNDLVTTGDESGTSDKLAKNLRDLKNRCRFNKSGLLPQLESQRDALQDKVEELDALRLDLRGETVLPLLVLPFASLQAALHIYKGAFFEELVAVFRSLGVEHYTVPFRPVYLLSIPVGVPLIGGNTQSTNGRSGLRVTQFGVTPESADDLNFIEHHDLHNYSLHQAYSVLIHLKE